MYDHMKWPEKRQAQTHELGRSATIIETRCTIITFTGVGCPSIFVTPDRREFTFRTTCEPDAWSSTYIAGVTENFSAWLAYIIVFHAYTVSLSIISYVSFTVGGTRTYWTRETRSRISRRTIKLSWPLNPDASYDR